MSGRCQAAAFGEHQHCLCCRADGMPTGDEIEGPNGYRLRFVRNDGEVLEMEATYGGRVDLPPSHVHPDQDEHYVVLEGVVRLVIAGEERRHGAGEAFDIP